MVNNSGMFSFDENFNYIGERWLRIDQSGTKGYEPQYGDLGRLPHCVMAMGPTIWMAGEPLDSYLRRADRLLFLAGRMTGDRRYCRRIDLVHNFLLRGTRAVEGFLHLLSAGDVMNAWAIARVLIERCIWLGYILSTEKVEEFYEYSALEVKKWAYKAASLGILELESVEDFDEEMEDELGHRLGKPAPQWDRLGVERMCKQAFDKPLSERLYKLYQLASMSTHPGMDDSGEYFMVAQVVDLGPSGGTGDLGPLKEMLEMSTEVFATLIALAETPLIEAATRFFDDERVRAFLMMRHEPSSLDDKLLGGEPS